MSQDSAPPHGRAAVFFDIDGVLNQEPGPDGVLRPEQVILIPGAGAAVAACRQASFLAIGVSNRAQVARGQMTLADLGRILARLQLLLAAEGGALDHIYFCPHHPEGKIPEFAIACECRKPGSLLFRRAIEEFSIDPARSFAIGDSLRDIAAAQAAGITAYGVRTGHGCRDTARDAGAARGPARMFDDVGAAVMHILSTAPARRLV